ncbi:hypothetical protein, partial [Oenococcus oeni]|uniref:hypothetical protein n=1 Tax=Oenococcus oeni TaxID=1247 RepID=UPI000AC8D280
KASHLFSTIVGAHLVASGITNDFQAITNHIRDAIDTGLEYEQDQQKMGAVWLTLTGSSGSASAMVKTINDLSVKTDKSLIVLTMAEAEPLEPVKVSQTAPIFCWSCSYSKPVSMASRIWLVIA